MESGSGQRPCHDQCQVWGGTSIGMGRRVGVVANRFCIFVRDGGSPVACVKAFLTHLLGISVRIDAVGEVQLIVRLLREDSQNFPRQGLRRDAAHVSLSLSLSLSLSRSGHLRVPPRFCGRSSCLCSVRLGSWDLRDPPLLGRETRLFFLVFFEGGRGLRNLAMRVVNACCGGGWVGAPFANTLAELRKMGPHGV